MKRLLTKYDNLFEVSFPYSMGWHGMYTIKRWTFSNLWIPLVFFYSDGLVLSCNIFSSPSKAASIRDLSEISRGGGGWEF